MKDFFLFRHMLIPVLIQIAFWLSVAVCMVIGILDFIHGLWLQGVATLILGPIVARMAAECIIIFFRINETLTEIKNAIQKTSKI